MHPFTEHPPDAVAALGEIRLIAQIRRWLGGVCPPAPWGIGDDCAVRRPTRGRQLITVDPVIYGRHFDDTVPPRAVGAKLLKRNLSDIAAMGGRPAYAVLSVSLDGRVSRRWLELFYRGLAAVARHHRVSIVGGDVAEVPRTIVASLTLVGEATGKRVLTRTGAQVGDWIYVTGQLGGSRITGHHYSFVPRLAEGAWLVRRREVRAMMDLSDGLASDLCALTPPGSVPALEEAALPLRGRSSVRDALVDGEDYELLFAVARRADRAALDRAWRRRFPATPLTCIGRFQPSRRGPAASGLRLQDYRGYEHFRSAP